MKIDLSQFRQSFLQESADHIASMETGLLRLRTAPDDVELLNSIFRSAHSIKGGAGSFGLKHLAHFTHSLENLLDRMRSFEVRATDEVIGTLLRSVDVLRNLLDADPNVNQDSPMPADAVALDARITALLPGESQPSEAKAQELFSTSGGTTEAAPFQSGGSAADDEARLPEENLPAPETDAKEITLYKVEFRPDREIFSSGTNPITLLRNLAALGTVSCCHLHTEDLPALADLDPTQCYLGWTVELASLCAAEELREVFEFVEHLAEIRISSSDRAHSDRSRQLLFAPPREEPVETRIATSPAASSEAKLTAPEAEPVFVDRRKAQVEDRRKSPVSDRRQSSARPASGGESTSIRVAIDKVDRLIDLVGELVIAHVMTAQMVEDFEPTCLPKLRESVAAMERNTRELHERVMGILMRQFHR